jgi:integrase
VKVWSEFTANLDEWLHRQRPCFQERRERAGIGPLRWHDLRHTFASWALQNGVTLPELRVPNYAHLAPDHLANAAEKVGTFRSTAKNIRITALATRARIDQMSDQEVDLFR